MNDIITTVKIDHEIDAQWHLNWEHGECIYENEDGRVIVESKTHRHPLGTQYAEVEENDF